jgi:hypothetical protein
VPVYAASALQTLGTTLLQKASKAAKSPLFVAGGFTVLVESASTAAAEDRVL